MPQRSREIGVVPAESRANMRPPRPCSACGLPLAVGVDPRTRYHADCRDSYRKRRSEIVKRLRAAGQDFSAGSVAAEMAKANPTIPHEGMHRLLTTDITEATATALRLSPGPQEQLQHVLASRGLYERITLGQITQADVAQVLDVHPTQVSRAVSALRDRAVELLAHATETRPEEIEALLYRVAAPPGGDETEVWLWAERAADAFMAFEARYFRLPGMKLYLRKPFHRRWIVEMMFAIATGGYLQILAPPRHGKSQLMVHFCVWLIARNPNIRILWCSASEPLASDFVWAVAQTLELNDRLVSECTLRGESFAPPKRGPGTTWTKSEFTVVNRDSVLVGATMQAIGTGGSILSRNADLLIADDIENDKTIKLPSTRANTLRWYTITWDSRKEEHTASITIGSRQHADDLYKHNLEDRNFRCIVDRAHDLGCQLPKYNVELHTDCVLFPEVRSYRWLLTKMDGADARDVGDGVNLFDLVYLNVAHSGSAMYWTNDILAPCRDQLRDLGLDGVPSDRLMVAGLDPAASGYQAAVLMAVAPIKKPGERLPHGPTQMSRLAMQDWSVGRWLVDLDNRRGGGVEAMLELMDEWLERYGCRHWVVENMAMQKHFTDDPRIKYWERINDARVEGFVTGDNKYNREWGLGSLVRLWKEGVVNLPYGTEAAKRKTDLLESQLLTFDGTVESERTRRKDLHMAFWFTNKVARRMEKELVARAAAELEDQRHPAYLPSYPGITRFSSLNEAPW